MLQLRRHPRSMFMARYVVRIFSCLMRTNITWWVRLLSGTTINTKRPTQPSHRDKSKTPSLECYLIPVTINQSSTTGNRETYYRLLCGAVLTRAPRTISACIYGQQPEYIMYHGSPQDDVGALAIDHAVYF